MCSILAAVLALFVGAETAFAQTPQVVFRGLPQVKVTERGVDRDVGRVTKEQANDLQCVVSRVGLSYYWASRNNLEMERVDAGAFTTYLARDGSGYVRVKSATAGANDTERRFDYVEHVLTGLSSTTYYGIRPGTRAIPAK